MPFVAHIERKTTKRSLIFNMKNLTNLKSKKGFTLIEVIVVLIIIAILAAATIPAMIGFVNDARGKSYAAEARVGLVASQAVVTELIASAEVTDLTADGFYNDGNDSILEHPTFIRLTSDVRGRSEAFSDLTIDIDVFNDEGVGNEGTNRVTGITYTYGGYRVIISPTGTAVDKI